MLQKPTLWWTICSLHMHRLTLQIMLACRSQAGGTAHLCNAVTQLVCHAFSLEATNITETKGSVEEEYPQYQLVHQHIVHEPPMSSKT